MASFRNTRLFPLYALAGALIAGTVVAAEPTPAIHVHHASQTEAATVFVATLEKSNAALMDDAMNVMNAGMTQARMNGDADHDFAAMMIPHHQGAVDMAKAELLYGKNPILRRLAQEIIVTQDQEIQVMHGELNRTSKLPSTNP